MFVGYSIVMAEISGAALCKRGGWMMVLSYLKLEDIIDVLEFLFVPGKNTLVCLCECGLCGPSSVPSITP